MCGKVILRLIGNCCHQIHGVSNPASGNHSNHHLAFIHTSPRLLSTTNSGWIWMRR